MTVGCIPRHHTAEKCTSGTLAKATMPNTEAKRPRWSLPSAAARMSKYAMYINSKMTVVVRRGSHVHQTFHTAPPKTCR